MHTEPSVSEHARILASEVFMRGANRPFGELTADDVRLRAQELRDAVGWGPTARVAPVAQAWRELSLVMERAGAGTVAELGGDALDPLAARLWVVLPAAAPPAPHDPPAPHRTRTKRSLTSRRRPG